MTARTTAMVVGLTMLVGLAVSADAKRYRAKYAGTSVITSVDSNDDGQPARENIFQVKTNPGGSGVLRSIGESTPAVPAGPGECDGLDLGEGPIVRSTVVAEDAVTTFQDGSQRFVQTVSGFTCVNATTGVLAGENEAVLLGGTGRWEGWTGTWTSRFRGQVLNLAVTIIAITGESTGEVTKAK